MKMDNFFKVALGVGAAIMPTISQALSNGMSAVANNPIVETAATKINPENMSTISSLIYNNPGATLLAYGGLIAVSVVGIFVMVDKAAENHYKDKREILKGYREDTPEENPKEGVNWGDKLKSFFDSKDEEQKVKKSLGNGIK